MRVSIITTCFNRERTIRGTIESVLGQDYSDIEYIIIDGASKDGSLKVINEYKDRIARIVSEPDGGMYEGLNKGLRMATGDIIGLVHSDDFLYSTDTISHIVRAFGQTGADMVYGNGIFVDEQDTTKIVRDWHSGTYKKGKVARGWLPLHPTVYITKEWLARCGMYDESYKIAADSEWLVRNLHDLSPKVHYIDEYIVRMRMGGLSTDPAKMKRKWGEDLRMYRSHGIHPHLALACKIASKVPQFVKAKFKINQSVT